MDSPQFDSEVELPARAETERLLVDARAGDASSLWRLTQSYRPYLKGVVRKTIGEPSAAMDDSDVLQRSLVQAVLRFPSFYGRSIKEWQSWLTTIVANEAKNVLRFERQAKRDIQKRVSLDALELDVAGESAAEEQIVRRERAEALLEIVNQLSPLDREMIQLRNFETLSYEAIADRLSISVEAARRRWCDAMKRLKQRVQNERP